MSLANGTKLGPYEIVAPLGAGGMGEVYRARDTKLNRDVAIKVLLPSVANDPDRLARFSREAQVLASLNHPNIAHIYGVEEANGVTGLVMELVDGKDLSQRIARGAIPIDEALPIARQIAEALEAAHELGIIHRDLKPANIKLRADGAVKVLDFGLAKAMDAVPGGQNFSSADHAEHLANSPTLAVHATEAGLILGTAGYMSPEQAAGKAVDKRSDLWAFGVVLLEMLTGRQTFGGETVSHVLAAVLKDDPDWTALPPQTPESIRKLLRRCLEKDRKRRIADAADARLEIDDALTEPAARSTAAAVPARRSRRRELAGWGLAAILAGVALTFAIRGFTAPAVETSTARFLVAPPDGLMFHSNTFGRGGWGSPLVVSPDGQRIALVLADGAGTQRLWMRTLDATAPRLLAGTEGASSPFWSPDSRWIAFFSQGKLKRIAIAGGETQILCDTGAGGGGTWSRDDVILFAPASSGESGLVRVPGGGGTPVPVTALDPTRGESNHLWPQFLPDGRHYLYVVRARESSGLYVGSLDSTDRTQLLGDQDLGDEYSRVEYVAPGYLLFVRNRALLAQPYDAATRRVVGEVIQVADNVLKEGPGSSAFSASANGVLAFWGGAVPPDTQLTWIQRDGTVGETVGGPGPYLGLKLAPDERTVAVTRFEPDEKVLQVALWLIEVQRNTSTKFTFGTGAQNPVWSRDSARIAFASPRGGPPSLFQKPLVNVGPDSLLFQSPTSSSPTDWAGGRLVYQSLDPVTQWDLWVLPDAGTPTPTPLLRTPSNESEGRVSPDGRWLAYVSDESGAPEVYVTGFPSPLGKWRISASGGSMPEWRGDGNELYYEAPDHKLMAVPVDSQHAGSALKAGTPMVLFELPILPLRASGYRRSQYSPAANGRRFLVRVPVRGGETGDPPATVVLNWALGIRK
ncbi:MAG: protein kinase [Acidobacteriota bacterium]|nr:protein kinase [Acidobacteriota bacterium]